MEVLASLVGPILLLILGVIVVNTMVPATKKIITPNKIGNWLLQLFKFLIYWIFALPFRIIRWIWDSVFGDDSDDDGGGNGGCEIHYHGGTHHHH